MKSIVSGQHETWPIRRRPRALAAAIASRSSNTAPRVGAVVQQRGDHHRAPGLRGQRFEERHRRVAALGEHVDAAAAFAHGARPARASRARRPAARASAGRPRRCAPGWCCWRSRPRRRHRVAHERLHLRDLVVGGGALGRGGTHHLGAHRRVADVGGDVDRAAAAGAAAPGTRRRSRSPSRCPGAARRATCPRPASGCASSARGRPAGRARS